MRSHLFSAALAASVLFPGFSWGEKTPVLSGSLQASNTFNPNISVIGVFQGEAGHRILEAGEEEPAAFEFKEAEIAFQSNVDAYARADVFVALEGEGEIELEEGYLTWITLPFGLQLKTGKFKNNLGRFNRVHTPESPFADRPLVHDRFLGEEGLAGAGGSLSWLIPNPWTFINLDIEAVTMPEAEESPSFGEAEKKDLLYVTRLGVFQDITESVNVTLGGSGAFGTGGQEFVAADQSTETLKTTLGGLDLTFRWKNPRRAIYRSALWQTEVIWSKKEISTTETEYARGLFTHIEYQFARRWRMGGRYDWSESPTNGNDHDEAELVYLTFQPSEFSSLSLQGKQTQRADGEKETLGFLKMVFNIGPHGSHPY